MSKATCRQAGAVTIVDISGSLMLGESSAVLRAAISDLIIQGRRQIILNFRDVTDIDSAGVGELVSVFTTLKKQEGHVKLLNPPKKINDMLELTRLSTVFRVYNDEALALRSFD